MSASDLERAFLFYVKAKKLPTPEAEYRFHPQRRWRWDFAWPKRMLAVEIEGATWSGGRHVRGQGFANDAEKQNEGLLLGWTLLRFTSEMVTDGSAIATLEKAFVTTRFWRFVERDTESGCWNWTGATQRDYGVFNAGRAEGLIHAHRFAWRTHGNYLDPELTLDHLCRNRSCVNPEHLEQVTRAENTMRGESPAAQNARKTHCKYGHPLTGENVVTRVHTNGRVHRSCKKCQKRRNDARYGKAKR